MATCSVPVSCLFKMKYYHLRNGAKSQSLYSFTFNAQCYCYSRIYLFTINNRVYVQFTKFIFIHIQCCYCYSRIYLFTSNNRVYVRFTFNGVFLIHDYIKSHLRRDVFIHIQRVIFVHVQDRNIHSTFSAHHLCASLGPSPRSIISQRKTPK